MRKVHKRSSLMGLGIDFGKIYLSVTFRNLMSDNCFSAMTFPVSPRPI